MGKKTFLGRLQATDFKLADLQKELSKADVRLVTHYNVVINQKEDVLAVNVAKQKILETEKQKEILNGLIHYVKNYVKVTGSTSSTGFRSPSSSSSGSETTPDNSPNSLDNRHRRQSIETNERYPSKYRKSSSEQQERSRSPHPPSTTTTQQSTKRPTDYIQKESSYSTRGHCRSKIYSRENEDRMKQQQQQPAQSESVLSSTMVSLTTDSSEVETKVEESLDKIQQKNSQNGEQSSSK